jgi:hypothetical protein
MVYDLPDAIAEQYLAANFAIRDSATAPAKRATSVRKPAETR